MAFTSAVNTENIKAGKLHHSRGRHCDRVHVLEVTRDHKTVVSHWGAVARQPQGATYGCTWGTWSSTGQLYKGGIVSQGIYHHDFSLSVGTGDKQLKIEAETWYPGGASSEGSSTWKRITKDKANQLKRQSADDTWPSPGRKSCVSALKRGLKNAPPR